MGFNMHCTSSSSDTEKKNAMSCSAIFSSFVWLLFVRKYGFIRNISRAFQTLRRKVWNAIKMQYFKSSDMLYIYGIFLY